MCLISPSKVTPLRQVICLPAREGWEPGSSGWLSARPRLTVEKAASEKPWNGPKTSPPPEPSEERERKLYNLGGIMPEVADISNNSILNGKSKPWDTKQVWSNSVMQHLASTQRKSGHGQESTPVFLFQAIHQPMCSGCQSQRNLAPPQPMCQICYHFENLIMCLVRPQKVRDAGNAALSLCG